MRIQWLLFALTLSVAWGKPVPEPESFAVIYRLTGQGLSELERQRPVREVLEVKTPVRRDYLAIAKARSPIRYPVQAGLRLVVRFRLSQPGSAWSFNQLEPTDFSLYLLQRESNRRVLLLAEQTPIRRVFYPGLPLRITPYGKDSLTLDLPSDLSAGEYAVVYGKDQPICDTFCFGLDGSGPPSSVSP